MNEWLLILGMTIVTFAARYSVIGLLGKFDLPKPIFRALKYVPPSVLTAIIVPSVLMPKGQIDLGYNNAYFYAWIFTAYVAWRSKNLLLTIVLGMAAFILWRLVFPIPAGV